MTEIIGLSGYARSGKDAAAQVLVKEYGFTRVAFADKLREGIYALDPIVHVGLDFSDYPSRRLQSVIDEFGWDGYKVTEYADEIRALLQRFGTEVGRQTFYDSIWIDLALDYTDADKIVASDCRFPNEKEAIESRGGKVWRVQRSGFLAVNAHKSETSLDSHTFNKILWNDGTLEEFQQTVRTQYENSL